MMSRSKGILVTVIAIVTIIGFLLSRNQSSPAVTPPLPETPVESHPIQSNAEKQARTDRYNVEASRSLRFDQSTALLANNPQDDADLSEEAHVLDNPDASDPQVMESIHTLLSRIRFLGKEKSYPAGLNVEVTNSLLGKNSIKVAYLPMDSLRINENGELIDEYETPFLFHTQSAKEISIISAGPDKELMTEDDIHYPTR